MRSGWGALFLFSLACGGKNTEPGPVAPPPPVLPTSLALELDSLSVALGHEVTVVARGRYADGRREDLTPRVTWRSQDPTIAEPDPERPGVFISRGQGTTVIEAALDSVIGTVNLKIDPPTREALALNPPSGDIGYGGSLQLAVEAVLSDDTRDQVPLADIVWSSNNPRVALVSASDPGLLVTFGEGDVTITAQVGDLNVVGEYRVLPPNLVQLDLTPQNPRITLAAPVQFRASGVYSDQSRRDLTSQVVWSSSNPAIVDISASGLATALGDGEVEIIGTVGNIEARTLARVYVQACPYPEAPNVPISLGAVLQSYTWLDARDEAGAPFDFRTDDLYCEEEYDTAVFVLIAGWCVYCPDYVAYVDSVSAELEANRMRVVYVAVENSSGNVASNTEANGIVDRHGGNADSVRVGEGDIEGGGRPFTEAAVEFVGGFPAAFVVRTRDMVVINGGQPQNLPQIAAANRRTE